MSVPSPRESKCNLITQVVVLNNINRHLCYKYSRSLYKGEKCILFPQPDIEVLRIKLYVGRTWGEEVAEPTAWGECPLGWLTVLWPITFSVNLIRSRNAAVKILSNDLLFINYPPLDVQFSFTQCQYASCGSFCSSQTNYDL